MKIVTSYDPPPIPTNAYDWHAWVEGEEEAGSWHGHTEADALRKCAEHFALVAYELPYGRHCNQCGKYIRTDK